MADAMVAIVPEQSHLAAGDLRALNIASCEELESALLERAQTANDSASPTHLLGG